MSYDAAERSNYDAVPTTLYEFAIGANAWRYSTGERDETVGGHVYTAMPISDNGIVQSGDVQNDDFTVTLPSNAGVAALYVATPPSQPVYLTVRKLNMGEAEAPVVWVGTVKSAKRLTQAAVEVACKVLTSSLNRNGLRLAWSKGCPHALYDRNCRADPASFDAAVQIQTMTGGSITAPGLALLPTDYLAGGFLEWELLPGVTERRAIETHSGNTIVLLGTTDGLAVAQWITVFPGCSRTTSTCELKFNNLSNYGGFPHMPSKSPFDGDPVF